jgi:hypothetical protein
MQIIHMSKNCIILLVFIIAACRNDKNIPDVSNIKVDITVQRFEQDFFALDTNNLNQNLDALSNKYPQFFGDFLNNILGLPPSDSSLPAIKSFIAYYMPVYRQTQQLFGNFSKWQREIERGLQFTKYYFPKYSLPKSIITFIGPMDAYFTGTIGAYGDAMTQAGPAIGLQLHLGANDSAYLQGMQQGAIFQYQVRRFEPTTIPVNVMKNIVDDMFPYQADGRPLVEQMIEKGKRLYVLDQLMPEASDTLKTGYSKAQLDLCNEHEGDIWNYFVKNELLYGIDPLQQRELLEDGPKTQELGEGVPGFIGLYTGWKIVQKWMEKNDKISLEELMKKDAKTLFNEAAYKPRSS